MKHTAKGKGEHNRAIGTVADAEAAVRGDSRAVLKYLKSAGTWTLGIAEKIGVAVATDALKKAISVGA